MSGCPLFTVPVRSIFARIRCLETGIFRKRKLVMEKERGPSVHFSCSKMSAEELSEPVLKKAGIDKVEMSFL